MRNVKNGYREGGKVFPSRETGDFKLPPAFADRER